jgi:hypothetical protein
LGTVLEVVQLRINLIPILGISRIQSIEELIEVVGKFVGSTSFILSFMGECFAEPNTEQGNMRPYSVKKLLKSDEATVKSGPTN